MCRFVPFFPPICRIGSDGLLSERGFGHCTIHALPVPGNPKQLIIIRQTGPPECKEKPGLRPLREVAVNGAGTTESLFRKSLPLAACPQHIHDAFKNLPVWQWLATATKGPFCIPCPGRGKVAESKTRPSPTKHLTLPMIEFCPMLTSGYGVPEVTCIKKNKMSRALSVMAPRGLHRAVDLVNRELVYG